MVLYKYKDKSVYIDGFYKEKLDNIKYLISKNWDCVFLIDGKERGGKSTLGFIGGCYLYPNMTINNIAKSAEDCFKKLKETKDLRLLMVDEGSMVFSSKDSMEKEKRKLLQVMDVVGQRNIVFIIVLPSFFDLNKTIAVRRSRFLLHVYTDKKMNRGRFCYFGERKKEILYDYGKKHFGSYAFPEADWVGRFYDFDPFGDAYKELKSETLYTALDAYVTPKVNEENIKRNAIIKIIKNIREKRPDIKIKEIAEMLNITTMSVWRYLKLYNNNDLSSINSNVKLTPNSITNNIYPLRDKGNHDEIEEEAI